MLIFLNCFKRESRVNLKLKRKFLMRLEKKNLSWLAILLSRLPPSLLEYFKIFLRSRKVLFSIHGAKLLQQRMTSVSLWSQLVGKNSSKQWIPMISFRDFSSRNHVSKALIVPNLETPWLHFNRKKKELQMLGHIFGRANLRFEDKLVTQTLCFTKRVLKWRGSSEWEGLLSGRIRCQATGVKRK